MLMDNHPIAFIFKNVNLTVALHKKPERITKVIEMYPLGAIVSSKT